MATDKSRPIINLHACVDTSVHMGERVLSYSSSISASVVSCRVFVFFLFGRCVHLPAVSLLRRKESTDDRPIDRSIDRTMRNIIRFESRPALADRRAVDRRTTSTRARGRAAWRVWTEAAAAAAEEIAVVDCNTHPRRRAGRRGGQSRVPRPRTPTTRTHSVS